MCAAKRSRISKLQDGNSDMSSLKSRTRLSQRKMIFSASRSFLRAVTASSTSKLAIEIVR
jgi:hypothetical protein